MQKPSYKEFELSSYLSGNNAAYVEDLYETFLQNPQNVDDHWRDYFQSLSNGQTGADVSHANIREHFREIAQQHKMVESAASEGVYAPKQEHVDALITAYRRFGHLNAQTDPLGSVPEPDSRLSLSHHYLSESDFGDTFKTRGVLSQKEASLKEIVDALKRIYCGTIGIEFTRLANDDERAWLRDYVERQLPAQQFTSDQKRTIFKELTAAEGLEKYLDVRYPGQKRFSIEGADSAIPMLDELAKRARAQGVHEMVIGMAHRGRLNVLINLMGQSPQELFDEFEGKKDYGMTTGDVKYHRGFSTDMKTASGPIHLSLLFNPSHLEFICPVAMGSTRARQERDESGDKRDYALTVMIHGDAAFSGQGVVMETLSMSQTRAYTVGGSIHLILNNQVGFTTSDPRDARSSHYCSDIARMIDAPVFHVNGDDPEAVVAVMQLAFDYRMQFHKDVVVDLVCYRRHGHQEVDEPRATQPLMYKTIRQHATTRKLYAEQLIKEGVVTQEEADQWALEYRDKMDAGNPVIDLLPEGLSEHYTANWKPFLDQHWSAAVSTAVPKDKIIELGQKLDQLPEGFEVQRNVGMVLSARKKMTAGEQPLDWGYAEIMAYATLIEEGHMVRLTGEDVRRGTFFHRHSFVFDQKTGEPYAPLMHLNGHHDELQIYDSLLSEAGPIGFEYGYATADPNSLIIWEAQFGDFANGGQVIIDQFMSSAWQKWNRLSGLVLLLPHGNEGMGPEHSSARLERYLQLCAQDNMQVCVPTTPAQIFHLLRRQVLRPYRKPLIVMTPKSLLRHKLAVSTLDDLAEGQFQLLIPEVDDHTPDNITRLVLCCGKVYYELLAQRREQQLDHIAIVRIEQLYPFPYDLLQALFAQYPNAKDVVWCQEEPKNQGAWFTTRDRLLKCLPQDRELRYIGRHSMSAPASGYPALYKKLQQELVDKALS